jgi:DNA-binding SARP family transcriptional activator
MADNSQLQISTLGGLTLFLKGERVTGLASRKVEALLVYLACTGRAQTREVLAEMFWEQRSQSRAMSNLRVVLSSLRKHLGPYVAITRESISLNPGADTWLDVVELGKKIAMGEIEAAAELYQGDFLEGFYLRDALGFEEWMTLERERYCWARWAQLALAQGDPASALDITDRLIASAPGRVITFLWKLKGEVLTVIDHTDEAESLLRRAVENAQATGERFLLWRVHVSLGRLYRTTGRQEAAEKEFSTARVLIEEMAANIPDEAFKTDFLQGAYNTLDLD